MAAGSRTVLISRWRTGGANSLALTRNYANRLPKISPDKALAESREVSEGIVLDYDEKGNLVGIDIDNARNKLDLKELVLQHLPSQINTLSA